MAGWTVRFGFVLVGAAVATACVSAPVDTARILQISDREVFLPQRRFLTLPGQTIGVLLRCPSAVLALGGRESAEDQYWFSTDGSSYQAVYVPVDKNPIYPRLEAPVGPMGERQAFENLSLATSSSLRKFGIRGEVVLVELEVNGGRGSPPADAFVATRLRRLDGTADFPVRLERVKAQVIERYQNWVSAESRRIEAELEKSALKALGQRSATGPREQMDAVYFTWLTKSRSYRVHCLTTITNGAYEYEGGIRIEFSNQDGKGGHGPNSVTKSTNLRYGTQFGVEFGQGFEVTVEGHFHRTIEFPLQSFQRELRPRGILGPVLAPPRLPKPNR